MHMPLVDKLQLYLAEKGATWSADAATWTEDGLPRLLVPVDGPLAAETLVDAHLRARAAGARLVVAHAGAPSPVALRTAARFGIKLLDATTLPSPAPLAADAPPADPAPEPTPLLLAHVEPPAAPAPFPLPFAGFFRALERAPLEIAIELPAWLAEPIELPPHAFAPPAPAEPDTPLPWDPALQAPEPEAAHVEPIELLAMPWAHEGEHAEVLPAGRETRPLALRPTTAPDWGLPWPRPTAPMDGVARVDPRLWQVPERIQAVRDDLDRAGVPSFGAVRPEGSAWLKRITEFGSP